MSQGLPERLDLLRLMRDGARLDGRIPLARCRRLRDALRDDAGEVQVSLAFSLGPSGQRIVRGTLEADLEMVCQRCLGEMRHHVASTFTLALVADDEEAKRLPRDLDPLLLDSAIVAPEQLIEDELILSLPIVARHADQSECAPRTTRPTERPDSPFAVLRNLDTGSTEEQH